MKLQELGAPRQSKQIAQIVESRLGGKFDVNSLSLPKARHMLSKVTGLLNEHRSGSQFHRSEKNPGYLKLLMLEHALKQFVIEQSEPVSATSTTPGSNILRDPQVHSTINRAIGKASRGQVLTPDEQKAVSAIALLKKEDKSKKRLVRESEIQQAQVVLAAQDMIDRLQGILEDVSEMQFKDLPALTDSIKNDMGPDKASQFQAQASQALSELLASVQQGKNNMESAQAVLTGQGLVVPGEPDADAGLEVDADLDVDAGLDADMPPEEPPESEPEAVLGRQRR